MGRVVRSGRWPGGGQEGSEPREEAPGTRARCQHGKSRSGGLGRPAGARRGSRWRLCPELRGHAEPGPPAAAGRGSALSRRSRPPHQRATLCALVALLGSLDGTASFKNTLCLSQAVCTGPAHICATPPLGSWLAQDGPKGYVPTIMKVCRCQNITKAGPKCDQACPHGHQNPCNGHGECLYESATCECDEGWQGERPAVPAPARMLARLLAMMGSIASQAQGR